MSSGIETVLAEPAPVGLSGQDPSAGPTVSVVVPLLDEEQSIVELTSSIANAMQTAGYDFEVWLVDDGSTDGSWNAIQEVCNGDARFSGLRFRRNYGKSAALAVGFEHARGKYVVTLDGDLQDDPREIAPMIGDLENGLDLVSGWKKKRQDPFSKKIPSRFFNFVTRKLSGIPLHDFNCGLKAYRCEVVKSVRVYGELHRYIPLLAKWEGYKRIGERRVQHHPRKYGETKFGFERFVRGFLDLLTVFFLTRFAVRPMHFFGGLGTIAFVGGFVISLYLSIDKLVFGNPLADRPLLLLGALMILVGSQMFLTGLLGEMIIRPRMEGTQSIAVIERTGDPS